MSQVLVPLFNLADFRAYRGYGSTHKRGTESERIRITGVSFTHNRANNPS